MFQLIVAAERARRALISKRRTVFSLSVLCLGLGCFLLSSCSKRIESEPAPQASGKGAFATNCGNGNAQVIFDGSKLASGIYGVKPFKAVGDPDLILIGNQWWMFFAAGPGKGRPVEYFSAYLPVGASLQTYTTYPSDPKGWRINGAQADGQGVAVPVAPSPLPGAWDSNGIETATVAQGPGGEVTAFYSGYSASPYTGNPMKIGILGSIKNGVGVPDPGNPVMSATMAWENYPKGVGELLEPAARYVPGMKKWVMYYTAGAWWGKPPNNELACAESADGIHWENRQSLGYGSAYYNNDWLYNAGRHRYEMTIAKDPTLHGGAAPRDIVWRMASKPGASQSDWTGEVTLLQYHAPGGGAWYNSGALSPAMKYGNLSGEANRLFVYFHSYSGKSQSIGRFYCDASQ